MFRDRRGFSITSDIVWFIGFVLIASLVFFVFYLNGGIKGKGTPDSATVDATINDAEFIANAIVQIPLTDHNGQVSGKFVDAVASIAQTRIEIGSIDADELRTSDYRRALDRFFLDKKFYEPGERPAGSFYVIAIGSDKEAVWEDTCLRYEKGEDEPTNDCDNRDIVRVFANREYSVGHSVVPTVNGPLYVRVLVVRQ